MRTIAAPLDQLLPRWVTKLDAPVTSRDPLGLQATSGQLADELLPGLNVFTSRARYYSFLCWALSRAGGELNRVYRLERLLVLGESLLHHQEPSDACPFIGRRRGVRFVAEGPDAYGWRLPSRVLKSQSANGALRLYRTSMVDMRLAAEDDEGGLQLTDRGFALATRYGRKLDSRVVDWALEESDARKREDSLLPTAREMCLSGRIDGHERGYLLASLFADDTEHALRRRETVRVLFAYKLLDERPPGEIASEDADAIAEDGGQSTAEAEARGNWGVLRRSLLLAKRDDILPVQKAAAYECLGLALNGVLSSVLTVLAAAGRARLEDMVTSLAPAGQRYGQLAGDSLALADEVLAGSSRAFELLASVTMDVRLRHLLEPLGQGPLVARALEIHPDENARDVARALLIDLAHHHQKVSARKGKGEWLTLEGDELVRRELYQLPPLVHTMRFAQLQQIVIDLRLMAPEVESGT